MSTTNMDEKYTCKICNKKGVSYRVSLSHYTNKHGSIFDFDSREEVIAKHFVKESI